MSEDVIKELIKTGVITQEVADEARVKVDKTLQACAFALHALVCNKEHEYNPEMLFQPTTEKCMFYVESDVLDDCWDAFDHNLWLKKTIRVMKEQEIADPEVMKEFLQKLTKVSMDARQFINQYPESFRLLEEIARA